MNIEIESKLKELESPCSKDFYEYDNWYIEDIVDDIEAGAALNLDEILEYCVLRKLQSEGYVSISNRFFNDIKKKCEGISSTARLDDLYDELCTEPLPYDLDNRLDDMYDDLKYERE